MSSSHFKLLPENCQKRYADKLSVNGMDLPDPLDEDIRDRVFSSKRLPNVTIFDIYTYLVERNKMYSKLSFKNYSSLPCFNYVASGKVKSTRCFRSETGICVVTARVEASQTVKKFHLPWIVANQDGEILSGHCTCMAGLGETCSHVGALLFFIENTIREEIEKPSCTSEPCKWNKTSTNVEPAPVANIIFSKPKLKKQPKQSKSSVQGNQILCEENDAHLKTFLQNVKTALPTAAIFNFISDSEDTDTAEEGEDTDTEENECDNVTFSEKVVAFIQTLPKVSLKSQRDKEKAFESLFKVSREEIKDIEASTKLDVKKWKKERTGRITASNFGKVVKCKTSHESLLYSIMGYQAEVSTAAIKWGKSMEKVAQDKFFQIISPFHVNLSIQKTGLFVEKEDPYLGATPDALVTCDCCEYYVLEIKCPFSHKEKFIRDIEKKNFFLDENGCLKDNHNYYEQIQGQMAIVGVSKGYFVTYTGKDLQYQTIELEDFKWEDTKNILKKFFFSVVFPEILSGKANKALEAASKECICKTKKVVSIITCTRCEETFHKSCIKYKRSLSWLCHKCK